MSESEKEPLELYFFLFISDVKVSIKQNNRGVTFSDWNITLHQDYGVDIFILPQGHVCCGMPPVIRVTPWLGTSPTAVWVWGVTWAGTSQSASSPSPVNMVWPTIQRCNYIQRVQNITIKTLVLHRFCKIWQFSNLCSQNRWMKYDDVNTHSNVDCCNQVLGQVSALYHLITAGVFAASLSSALGFLVSAPKVFQVRSHAFFKNFRNCKITCKMIMKH